MLNNCGISIVIPVYNAEQFLDRCLKSLDEKMDYDEIILINDGSTDKSKLICEEYKRKNKNVCVVHQKNSGVSAARNAGIQKAMNDWVMFVDADDYLITGWREIIRSTLREHSSCDLLIFAHDVEDGAIDRDNGISAAIGFNHRYGNTIGFPFSKLYKTNVIKKSGIKFSPKLINGEDMIFNANFFAVSNANYIISKSIYAYYKNMSSATNRFNSQIIETERQFHVELSELFNKNHLTDIKWKECYEMSLLTGIYAIIYRVALSETDNSKIIHDLVRENEYRNALTNIKQYRGHLSKKQYVALELIRRRKTIWAIYFVRIICMLKRIYYKKKQNGIIEII